MQTRLIAVLTISASVLAGVAARTGVAGQQAYNADQLDRGQFKALPDSAVIERNGQRMTKAEILAQARRRQEQAAAARAAAAQRGRAAFDRKRTQFAERERARLAAGNARTLAEARRLEASAPRPGSLEAIRREAAQLRDEAQRSTTAAGRARIERRAAELLRLAKAR